MGSHMVPLFFIHLARWNNDMEYHTIVEVHTETQMSGYCTCLTLQYSLSDDGGIFKKTKGTKEIAGLKEIECWCQFSLWTGGIFLTHTISTSKQSRDPPGQHFIPGGGLYDTPAHQDTDIKRLKHFELDHNSTIVKPQVAKFGETGGADSQTWQPSLFWWPQPFLHEVPGGTLKEYRAVQSIEKESHLERVHWGWFYELEDKRDQVCPWHWSLEMVWTFVLGSIYVYTQLASNHINDCSHDSSYRHPSSISFIICNKHHNIHKYIYMHPHTEPTYLNDPSSPHSHRHLHQHQHIPSFPQT